MRPELHVFVEDPEGGVLLREILASDPAAGSGLLERIAIRPVGPANVVQLLGRLGSENKLPYKSVGIVDGDTDATVGCSRLPGTAAPERVLFQGLKAKGWPNLPERFSVGAGDLFAFLDDPMLEPDHHRWAKLVGDRIIKSRTAVWEILANEWVKQCLNAADRTVLVEAIKARLS